MHLRIAKCQFSAGSHNERNLNKYNFLVFNFEIVTPGRSRPSAAAPGQSRPAKIFSTAPQVIYFAGELVWPYRPLSPCPWGRRVSPGKRLVQALYFLFCEWCMTKPSAPCRKSNTPRLLSLQPAALGSRGIPLAEFPTASLKRAHEPCGGLAALAQFFPQEVAFGLHRAELSLQRSAPLTRVRLRTCGWGFLCHPLGVFLLGPCHQPGAKTELPLGRLVLCCRPRQTPKTASKGHQPWARPVHQGAN